MLKLLLQTSLISLISLIFITCSTDKIIKRVPLVNQRIAARPGYEGHLTNQYCEKYKDDKCEKWNVIKYDLRDKVVRKELNDLRFACRIGGKRWRINIDKPEFIRKTNVCLKKCWYWLFACCEYEVKHIPLANYNFLINGATHCKKGY